MTRTKENAPEALQCDEGSETETQPSSKERFVNNCTATPTVAQRMSDAMHEGLAAEEDRFADAGVRTIRIFDNIYDVAIGELVWVIKGDRGVFCTGAGRLGLPHSPVGDALPGETYSFRTQGYPDRRRSVLVTQTFIGMFNVIAEVEDPITGQRITLLAEGSVNSEESTAKTVAANVKTHMVNGGHNSFSLCRASGLSRSTFNRRLSGIGGEFSVVELWKLGKALNVSPSIFLGVKGGLTEGGI